MGDFTQVHLSGLPEDVGDDPAVVSALEGCGVTEGRGWLLDVKVARHPGSDLCRGFAFISFLSKAQAEAAVEHINNSGATIMGSPIQAQLAKPREKAKKKGASKGQEDAGQLALKKKRLPSQAKHPESTTCSAVTSVYTQRRGSEASFFYKGYKEYYQQQPDKK